MRKKTHNLNLETTYDFDGYPDYYSGHGHAFAFRNLIVCIPFSIPINYKETVKEVIEAIIEDINSCAEPFIVINEKLFKKYEEEIRNLTNDDLEKSLRNALIENVKDSDKFFDVDIEIEDDEFGMEYPLLIGYIHVYVED